MRTTSPHNNVIERTLRNSILDGASHSAMLGLTRNYVVPFALTLQATTAQIGLLASVPSLTMALSQMAAPALVVRAGSRKRLILPAAFCHAAIWLPILLIPYLFASHQVWWLIGLLTLSAVAGSLGIPAWGSIMADLVPEGIRGKFFGSRGRICGIVVLISFFLGGAVLQFCAGNAFIGFSIIFGGAALFRLASWYFLKRMHEPRPCSTADEKVNLLGLLVNLKESNLGRFVIFASLMNLATSLGSPFMAVYMLRDLGFDYLTFVAINSVTSVASLMSFTFWGRRADRAGNVRILRITALLIPLVPILWTISTRLYVLIPVQLLSGFAWSGFILSSSNFIYDAATPQTRTHFIAIYTMLTGLAISIGAVLGGLLAPILPDLFGNRLITLFLLSGVLRYFVAATFLYNISEVRRVPAIRTVNLLFDGIASLHNRLGAAFAEIESLLFTLPVGVTRRDSYSVSTVLRPATIDCYVTVRHTRIPPVLDDS